MICPIQSRVKWTERDGDQTVFDILLHFTKFTAKVRRKIRFFARDSRKIQIYAQDFCQFDWLARKIIIARSMDRNIFGNSEKKFQTHNTPAKESIVQFHATGVVPLSHNCLTQPYKSLYCIRSDKVEEQPVVTLCYTSQEASSIFSSTEHVVLFRVDRFLVGRYRK